MLCESSQKRRKAKPVAAYELLLLLQATGNRNLLTFNPQQQPSTSSCLPACQSRPRKRRTEHWAAIPHFFLCNEFCFQSWRAVNSLAKKINTERGRGDWLTDCHTQCLPHSSTHSLTATLPACLPQLREAASLSMHNNIQGHSARVFAFACICVSCCTPAGYATYSCSSCCCYCAHNLLHAFLPASFWLTALPAFACLTLPPSVALLPSAFAC